MNRFRSVVVMSAVGAAASCTVTPTDEQGQPLSIFPNRPTFSDGTSLVPHGHLQIETGYTFTHRHDGADIDRHNVPEVLARYRVFDSLEARLLWGGYAWSDSESGGTREHADGATDLALAIVVPIVGQDDLRPAVALEVASTLGAGDSDFSTQRADPTLKVLWSYGGGRLPDWLGVGGNLNASFPTESGERFTQTAASLYATVNPFDTTDTTFFGEWYVVSPYAKDTHAAHSLDAGVVQRVTATTAVDARIGLGLNEQADDLFAGVGFSVIF